MSFPLLIYISLSISAFALRGLPMPTMQDQDGEKTRSERHFCALPFLEDRTIIFLLSIGQRGDFWRRPPILSHTAARELIIKSHVSSPI